MQFDSGYSGYYHPPLYPPPYPYGWAPIPVPQYASYAPPSQQPLHFEEFYEASYRCTYRIRLILFRREHDTDTKIAANTYQPFPQLNMVRDPYYAAIPQCMSSRICSIHYHACRLHLVLRSSAASPLRAWAGECPPCARLDSRSLQHAPGC